MKSGGNVLKRFISLTALLLSLSLVLFQSNSFTTAALKNDATLSIVPEENALIAINYGEGRMFAVTNNTANAITIESHGPIHIEGTDSFHIMSEGTNDFTLAGAPEDLIGGSIHIIARWNGGSAEIQSMIPESSIEQIGLESAPELVETPVSPEVKEESVVTEVIEESVDPEIIETPAVPEIIEESVAPEIIEAPMPSEIIVTEAIPEIDGEQ